MSNPKLNKAAQKLVQEIPQDSKNTTERLMQWLLRAFLVSGQHARFAGAGFVLPTTAALLLVVSLVVGAMLFRTSSRTQSVLAQRQQQVIYNAATPAIDRARAKIEVLFDDSIETRVTGLVPAETQLHAAMINDNTTGGLAQRLDAGGNEYYTLPDETRLDINQDSDQDNAWAYPADLDGDGTTDATVAYSIIFQTPDSDDANQLQDQTAAAVEGRANALQVRHAPYSPAQDQNNQCSTQELDGLALQEQGWFPDGINTAILRKNFQVNAVVIPHALGNNTLSTLEFHQDRRLDRGNKWGAWFRNDLEIFPGPLFQWNGAMHTEGNMIIGQGNQGANDPNQGNPSFISYLVSSPESCLDIQEASTVSVTERVDSGNQTVNFQGQFVGGKIGRIPNNMPEQSIHHLYDPTNPTRPIEQQLAPGNDSTTTDPTDDSLEPIPLFTEDRNENRDGGDQDGTGSRVAAWDNSQFVARDRMENQEEEPPFVDDTYRADDRYGPKPVYDDDNSLQGLGQVSGNDITGNDTLTNNSRNGGDPSAEIAVELGLDGYWERRARVEGMKILVSPRLELGNTYGWGFDGDSDGDLSHVDRDGPDVLYPILDPEHPNPGILTTHGLNEPHLQMQRRTMRDNLAAVQAAVVYHYQGKQGDEPLACIAATSHFGTPKAIANSITFTAEDPNSAVYPRRFDFFTGNGTNGWEFVLPNNYTSRAEVQTALRNLSNFAGDPLGAFPPTQDAAGGNEHPHSYMRMWGDFSNLRRSLNANNGSIADQTYQHTSACMLGMLAYNVDTLRNDPILDVTTFPTAELETLGNDIVTLVGSGALGANATEVAQVSIEEIADQLVTANPGNYPDNEDIKLQRLRLISHMIQVERDRRYGFADSTEVANFQLPQINGLTFNQMVVANDFSIDISGTGAPFNNTNLACNPTSFETPLSVSENASRGLAIAFCNQRQARPKYPALYYVFPLQDHDRDGDVGNAPPDNQPINDASEPYVYNMHAANAYLTANANGPYQVVNLAQVALQPNLDPGNWTLPNDPAATNTSDAANLIIERDDTPLAVPFLERVFYNGRELMTVRTLDIDLDMLRQNKTGTNETNSDNLYDFHQSAEDNWLSVRGIVYAFREDAVREDALARPASNAPCFGGAPCHDAVNNTDPPLTGLGISPKPVDYYADPERRPHGFRLLNGRTLKRVSPPPGAENVDETNVYGISFVSDNPVYVQGDFNLHVPTNFSAGTPQGYENARIEEFSAAERLDPGFTLEQFYDRENLDLRFARPDEDDWRPTEVLTDALTILSANFCEGSVVDWLITPNPTTDHDVVTEGGGADLNLDMYTAVDPSIDIRLTTADGCGPSDGLHEGGTSFVGAIPMRTRRINAANLAITDDQWLRENSFENDDDADPYNPVSPPLFSYRGNPLYVPIGSENNTTGLGNMREFASTSPIGAASHNNHTYSDLTRNPRSRDGINDPVQTRVNLLTVSGLVPSRPDQSYGGMHNFPRFLEDWRQVPLNFAGSLLQLNFSTYATAPFEQDAWEPGATPTIGGPSNYDGAPQRNWGYDVALQYAIAGPVAERFVTQAAVRSEFYSEPSADDPYIRNLCLAALDSVPTNKGCY